VGGEIPQPDDPSFGVEADGWKSCNAFALSYIRVCSRVDASKVDRCLQGRLLKVRSSCRAMPAPWGVKHDNLFWFESLGLRVHPRF